VLSRVLDPAAERQLADARRALDDLATTLATVPATGADAATLAGAVRQLDDFFLLVVVGEFNAGKSAFVNALVGRRVLEEGVTPTTAQITVVGYGPDGGHEGADDGTRRVSAPVDLLRDLHIVDTPGTNAIVREHERLTTDFVPRSDLVLFVTSSDRPFTETERALLEVIRDWGKKIVVVVNKIDLVERPDEVEAIVTFVRDGVARLLDIRPEVFPVSARLAWRAKQGEPALWAASRFEPLERFIRETLDEEERFRLKLSNPLGVGEALAKRYAAVAREHLALLEDDTAALDDVDRQLAAARDDMADGFTLRMTTIEKILLEMEARGHAYFDDTLRVGRVFDLMNKSRIEQEFEERVVSDTPRHVEREVAALVEWMVDHDFRQWQAVTSRLAARQREHADRVLGGTDAGVFHSDRTRLIESVGREAQRVVDRYDQRREAQAISEGARQAVAASAAMGAGALGLGAVVTVAASTAVADVTGLVAAGVMAAVGFFIIPAKRKKARADMREKVSALREQLVRALRGEFTAAQQRSAERLDTAVAPYARFVRTEQQRWQELAQRLDGWQHRAAALLSSLEP
jgi:small GTP-binding protein